MNGMGGRARAADAATAVFSARKTTAEKKCFFTGKTVKSKGKKCHRRFVSLSSSFWVSFPASKATENVRNLNSKFLPQQRLKKK